MGFKGGSKLYRYVYVMHLPNYSDTLPPYHTCTKIWKKNTRFCFLSTYLKLQRVANGIELIWCSLMLGLVCPNTREKIRYFHVFMLPKNENTLFPRLYTCIKFCNFQNVFSETAWPIFTIFHMGQSVENVLTICSNGSAPLNYMYVKWM